MAPEFKIVFTGNCGLFIKYGNTKLIIDALNGKCGAFEKIHEATWDMIMNGSGDFSDISGLMYTHLHEDHYSEELNSDFLKKHSPEVVFIPGRTDIAGTCGAFELENMTIEYFKTPHSGKEFSDVSHYVFYISCQDDSIGKYSLFITGDADFFSDCELDALNGRQPDFAFINPLHIATRRARELVRSYGAKKVYIYHLPNEHDDIGQMRTRCFNDIGRCRESGIESEIIPVMFTPMSIKIER